MEPKKGNSFMEEISKILVTVVVEKNQTVKKVIQGIEKLMSSSQYKKDVNLVSVKETK